MKRHVVQCDTERDTAGEELVAIKSAAPGQKLFPFILLAMMVCAFLLLDAVLPLEGFWFHTALLTQTGSWALLPTHLLFPGWGVTSSIPSLTPAPPSVALSWRQLPLLLAAILALFLVYVCALRRLSQSSIGFRYILSSTFLLGLLCILVPVVTSPDIFSYISYARIGVIYHLNPLTTLPTTISSDPIFIHLYWKDQPSAYGPTWVALSSLLQWLALPLGIQALLPMVLALRVFGLFAHLCSTWLIWSIMGQLQQRYRRVSPQKRLVATLAFAWNPLLLFESCVNAHNDSALLLFILLAIHFLLPASHRWRGNILATLMLVLATCLKLNAVLLMPLFFIYIWKQERQENVPIRVSLARTFTVLLAYAGTIILLFAPFWQNGQLLRLFQTNPTTSQNINTVAEFLSRLYISIMAAAAHSPIPVNIPPAEGIAHTVSIALFVLLYALLCWQAIVSKQSLKTLPSLVRWLALAWLLYCVCGTPWFWPWYAVTFFGLYALVAATNENDLPVFGFLRLPLPSLAPFAPYLLAFSMLSIYCFYAWGPHASFIPGLPGFQWAYLRGLWAWVIPLLALRWPLTPMLRQHYQHAAIRETQGETIASKAE